VLRRGARRAEGVIKAPAEEAKNHADENQYRPNHHDISDVQPTGINPSPDESVKAANQSKNSMQHAVFLKELNQDDDETDNAPKPTQHPQNSYH
jgi:hypothetical protein